MNMAHRRPFVGGNHKMNGTVESLNALLKAINASAAQLSAVELVVAPPTILVEGHNVSLLDAATWFACGTWRFVA